MNQFTMPSRERNAAMQASSRSIFIVDDHLTIQKTLSEIIACLGYNTLTASDGYEAVQTYSEKREQIGLVVLDVIMPGMNGMRTLEKLREIDPGVKVIMCSAYVEPDQLPDLDCSTICGFITKPCTISSISEKLKTYFSN